MCTVNRSLFVFIIVSSLCACGNSSKSSLSNGNNFSITESNMAINDLEYIIGIKIRKLAENEAFEKQFNDKKKEIESKYENEINLLIEKEGLSPDDFTTDTTVVGEFVPQEYHIKKEKVREKINELSEKEKQEKLDLSKTLFKEVVNKDETLQDLIKAYNNQLQVRNQILQTYGIDKSDSAKFFNRKLKSMNLSDEALELLKSGIF